MASYQKSDSDNRCVFTQGKILPNFIPIGFETKEDLYDVLKRSPPRRRRKEQEQEHDE